MNKAVFFDRDGVINRERGYTYELKHFEILPDVFDVLKELQERGYLLIIVSNQSGVAKKMYAKKDVEVLHEHFLNECKENDIELAEVYYCVHHPDTTNCICRMPDSLFIEKSIARFELDPHQCYFISDRDKDLMAGEKAGVKGILIEANSSLKEHIKTIA